jgi:YD repeat-containing protein
LTRLEYRYDESGRLDAEFWSFSIDDYEPETRTYHYDAQGRVTQRSTSRHNTTTEVVIYEYDPVGNLTTEAIGLPGVPPTRIVRYDYACWIGVGG